MDGMILIEQPDGLPWIVAHNTATRTMAVAPAPPEWASPGLAEAAAGSLRASVDGYCVRCEAVRPAAPDGEAPPVITARVPHAAWCPWSAESVSRLERECRPPGTRWVADTSEEAIGRLGDYLEDLADSLAAESGA